MPVKRCAVCKRPTHTTAAVSPRAKKWLCPACEKRFDEYILKGKNEQGGKICEKCKKRRNGRCRFTGYQRQKITACSDWEGRNTEHDKRRWAKFEITQD